VVEILCLTPAVLTPVAVSLKHGAPIDGDPSLIRHPDVSTEADNGR
jgi:hypothetical protein